MSVLQARARHNALKRYRSEDDPEVVTARRELAVESMADHIRKTVEAAPPLTPEQRARLTLLLSGGVTSGTP